MDQETKEFLKGQFEEADKRAHARLEESDKKTDDKIESLARAVKRGFDDVDKRFNAVAESIVDLRGEMKQEFKEVNGRLGSIERDLFYNVVRRDEFEGLVEGVKYIETKLGIESTA